jgi:hypothetical protein
VAGHRTPETSNTEEGFITDRQMKALSIVIRHAVYDAVSRLYNPGHLNTISENYSVTNAEWLGVTMNFINSYMEPPGSPELEAAYQRIKSGEFDPPGFVPDCRRSES